LIGIGLGLPSGTAASPKIKHDGSSLVVKVRGLPAGAPGDVLVRGPHRFKQTLQRSGRLRNVPSGRYRIAIRPVLLTRHYKGVPGGSRAYPAERTVRVRVKPGHAVSAVARYGTIRSGDVLVLHTPPKAVIGTSTNPAAIVLPGSLDGEVRPGRILATSPRPGLPGGLFHRVTKVAIKHRQLRAYLKPASVWDAFPALDLEATVPLSPRFEGEGGARSSDLGSVDLAFSAPLIPNLLEASCGAPPTGWSLHPSGSLRSWVTSDLHRRYFAIPYGKLKMTVEGELGLAATIPTGAHCGFTVDGPHLQGFVPVFDVPVPVEGKADLKVSLQSDAPIDASFNAKVKSTVGIDLNGKQTKAIVESSKQGSGSFKATAGEVDIGAEFQGGLGASGLNAHLAVEPHVAVKGSTSGCEVDLGLTGGVGLDFPGFHPSFNPVDPSTPVYHCPVPDGVFFDGKPGSGAPPSTLGPYTMTSFGTDPQDTGEVNGVADPAGNLVFPQSLDHELVGQGWATWSNGYPGDVYVSDDSNTASVELPAHTHAFYLYAEPNVFADFTVTATTPEGASSGPVTVYGESGATYFGFYATGSKTLSRVTVTADDLVAIGEFGISR
jgi:hypothetical protein